MRGRSFYRGSYIAGLWIFSMAVQISTEAYAAGMDVIQSGMTGIFQGQTVLLASAEDGASPRDDISRSYPASDSAPKQGVAKPSGMNKPPAHRSKQHERSTGSVSPAVSGATARAESRQPHKLVLQLSTTLSDSGQAIQPDTPASTNGTAEVEPAAKEKKLSELYAQIAATEKLIEAQQRQLDTMESPSDPVVAGFGQTNTSSGDSKAADIAGQQSKPDPAPRDIRSASDSELHQARSFEVSRLDLAIGLVIMSFSALVLFGYRKIRSIHRGQPEVPDSHEDGRYPRLSAINQAATPRREHTIKTPAYIEQKTQSILPPEYEMLEEADIYLRFGHDKLAEEALREAININPKNPQAYLTLLRICFSRKDSAAFVALARQLQPLSDENAWAKVAEMGRALDPANTLYS
jgi:Tfp pilus assembly protein FimV